MIQHDDQHLVAGMDWIIVGTLLNSGGTPLDLTTYTLLWILVDFNGEQVDISQTVAVDVVDPPTSGVINITVPRAVTTALAPGRYSDFLQANNSETTVELVWGGALLVSADPNLAPLQQ